MKNEIDNYIEGFPPVVQKQLKEIRAIIKSAAPEAQELISYCMPAYKLNGVLVYFAGYKGHIGFYPTPSGIKQFLPKIQEYKHSKGAVQFPIDQPLPGKVSVIVTQTINIEWNGASSVGFTMHRWRRRLRRRWCSYISKSCLEHFDALCFPS